ncbi:MAG: hypothetical protein KBA91_01750 [Candidatus Moranbacteria bacterium]|jgi:hypothetical protein|nr:hypothetical protein [Candidatus Moranbacteria bacterium]
MTAIRLLLCLIVVALTGCAMNPRFETSLPSDQITGEKVCEIPQHWKALALTGVNTREELSRATIVQVRLTPEWVGDSLGWPVPFGERGEVKYLPRLVWQAFLVTKTGEKRFYPAIAKNALTNPYFTVLIHDLTANEVNGSQLLILSGAHTKVLTLQSETVSLRGGKDCVDSIDEAFFRMFPSTVVGAAEVRGDHPVLSDLRKVFPWPINIAGEQYSLHADVLTREAMGNVRQTTYTERFVERGGGRISFPLGVGTAINNAVPALLAIQERYVGPFGERQYSPEEAAYLLAARLRSYSAYVHEMEDRLGKPAKSLPEFSLAFEGERSGWQVANDLFLDIEDLWSYAETLRKELKEKGTVQFNGLPSGRPNNHRGETR